MIPAFRIATIVLGGALASITLVACTHEASESLNANAVLGAAGPARLTYRAPLDGTVSVYDVQDDSTFYTGKVSRNDRIALDVESDQVVVNDKPVADAHLKPGHDRRIYFEPPPYIGGASPTTAP